jgi:hypothetical protein
VDPDPHGSALFLVCWIRIRGFRQAKWHAKKGKSEEMYCFEVLDVLF